MEIIFKNHCTHTHIILATFQKCSCLAQMPRLTQGFVCLLVGPILMTKYEVSAAVECIIRMPLFWFDIWLWHTLLLFR